MMMLIVHFGKQVIGGKEGKRHQKLDVLYTTKDRQGQHDKLGNQGDKCE